MSNVFDPMEEATGRATRARTRLIVEGFSNLALVAILFSGVQAQLISVTNNENDTRLAVATNAVFFGGLIFSVFTTMLATLCGRWFSLLREDDSDFLSSCWLSQDCAEKGEEVPKLEDYLKYQIESIEKKIMEEKDKIKERRRREQQDTRGQVAGNLPDGNSSSDTGVGGRAAGGSEMNPSRAPQSQVPVKAPNSQVAGGSAQAGPHKTEKAPKEDYNPMIDDLNRIVKLLKIEKENGDSRIGKRLKSGPTTLRERIVSYAVLSALGASLAAFLLFCTGILMLTWNKQPRAVAVFTTATVVVCVMPIACLFLRHRRKHVIQHLLLARMAF